MFNPRRSITEIQDIWINKTLNMPAPNCYTKLVDQIADLFGVENNNEIICCACSNYWEYPDKEEVRLNVFKCLKVVYVALKIGETTIEDYGCTDCGRILIVPKEDIPYVCGQCFSKSKNKK